MIQQDDAGRKFCDICERTAQRHRETTKSDSHAFHFTGSRLHSLHLEQRGYTIVCEQCFMVTTPANRTSQPPCVASPVSMTGVRTQRYH